jgi:prolyl-tRNA editing enzyme YbaK/EbsC (Cys-tRNA(Pro) deacylase)
MSIEKVREYLGAYGLADKIQEFDVSSATVELAAIALGVEGARIAKTLSFYTKDGGCMLIVAAGDTKVDNSKFKAHFGFKAKMMSFDDALSFTGHAVGGVCPFGVNEGVEVYLDESMKRFEKIYPACGSSNSAVELSIEELEKCSEFKSWVDVVVY